MHAGIPLSRDRVAAGRLPVLLLSLAALAAGCASDDTRDYAVPPDSPLLDPESPEFAGTAPDTFHAQFETSEGPFVVEVVSAWAPVGADRLYNLIRNGYYDGARFFRAVDGFMVQFGLHGDPVVNEAWQPHRIMDDPVQQSNRRGYVTFAKTGDPDSRTTQLFINLADNAQLDDIGFAPVGRVIEGMDVVDRIHTGYGGEPPDGVGPQQARIRTEGNAYLVRDFPELDHVERVTIVHESAGPQQAMEQ